MTAQSHKNIDGSRMFTVWSTNIQTDHFRKDQCNLPRAGQIVSGLKHAFWIGASNNGENTNKLI